MTPPEPLDPSYRPQLRPGLAGQQADGGVVLFDPMRIGQPIPLTRLGLEIVRRFDGTRTLRDVQTEIVSLTGGAIVPLDTFASLVAGLDEALLLESPRYTAMVKGPVRKPSCIGSYEGDPAKLRTQLRKLFTAPGGPGMPREPKPSPHGRLRAALLPHMDYGRGNITYGWGFKELVEQTDARVFVIVATSHYSMHRFTLTRQNFETPLGTVETDQNYIDRLEREYGEGLFEDVHAHLPEHSIELEVVLLQYLLEGTRPFHIVPLLVGSFSDCVDEKTSPDEASDIRGMADVLRRVEAMCEEPVCYLISGDLAHIGPKFGDKAKAAGSWLDESRRQDESILQQIERADPKGYYETIAAEDDRRRICGLPPTWLTLAAAQPKKGRVLHYQQFVHPQGHESVSFAAAAFYE